MCLSSFLCLRPLFVLAVYFDFFFSAYKKAYTLFITQNATLAFTRPSSSLLLFWIIASAPLSLCHQSSDHPIFFFVVYGMCLASSLFSTAWLWSVVRHNLNSFCIMMTFWWLPYACIRHTLAQDVRAVVLTIRLVSFYRRYFFRTAFVAQFRFDHIESLNLTSHTLHHCSPVLLLLSDTQASAVVNILLFLYLIYNNVWGIDCLQLYSLNCPLALFPFSCSLSASTSPAGCL